MSIRGIVPLSIAKIAAAVSALATLPMILVQFIVGVFCFGDGRMTPSNFIGVVFFLMMPLLMAGMVFIWSLVSAYVLNLILRLTRGITVELGAISQGIAP